LFEMEIGEVVLESGNLVSTGVLTALGFWAIDVLITTRNGYPIAMLKSLEDDTHVKTRICQYEALKNGKVVYLVKQFAVGKIEGKDRCTFEAYLNKFSFGNHYNFSADVHIYSFSFFLCFQEKQ